MNCEVCQKPIEGKELKSAKAGTAFKFFDHHQEKEVAYHPSCYDEKWNKHKKPATPEFKPKNV